MKKKFSILLALVMAVSLLMAPVAASANVTTHTFAGSDISVVSLHTCDTGAETEEAFDNEAHKTVVDPVAFDAQSGPVTIEGVISELNLGPGWVNTAYLEIGVAPEATMDDRNAGVYLIAFNSDVSGFTDGVETLIHLQDYSGDGNDVWATDVIRITKDSAFHYVITLTPNTVTDVGGIATLKVWVGDVLQTPEPTIPYGCASTWQEDVEGEFNEDFTFAHLFYSIIADRRGVEGETYSATVGDVTITGADTGSTDVGGEVAETPTVTSVSPASGHADASLSVTITGTGFAQDTTTVDEVTFSGEGVTAEILTVSATEITATVTITADAPAGLRDVSVTIGGKEGTGDALFEVTYFLTVTAPSAIELGMMTAGETTTEQSALLGSVDTNYSSWIVTAADMKAVNTGHMVSGTDPLAAEFQIGEAENPDASAVTGFQYTGPNPTSLPFFVSQDVAVDDVAGSYTITITFIGSY